ncbi:MAG: GTP-binding protein [Candidatus Campbellbacteria bacterium]|nr:GTP-binding protein [Candidatus Campbellbacteria bacterium]
MEQTDHKQNTDVRPPVVVILGHVNHGKSTLLEYIRKIEIVDKEHGGITQRISAYEIHHKTKEGIKRNITFLDTPGHESFQHMRLHGAELADIAVLVVSAEEGVKAQTREALEAIKTAKIPFVVAFNKMDTPKADIERAKISLLENGVILEGLGGDVSFTPISAKKGSGIDDLLDLIVLAADIENFSGNRNKKAEGFVIESHIDPKKGVASTLLIKNGSFSTGDYIVADGMMTRIRKIENDRGESIKKATFSSPILIHGFDSPPNAGGIFKTYHSINEARKAAEQHNLSKTKKRKAPITIAENEETKIIPITILAKAGTVCLLEALEKEIGLIKSDKANLCIVDSGIGDITQNDVVRLRDDKYPIAVGFQNSINPEAALLAEEIKIPCNSFNVIYDLTRWISEKVEEYTKAEFGSITGSGKVIALFNKEKKTALCGILLSDGTLHKGEKIRIIRDSQKIGEGTIQSLKKKNETLKEATVGEIGLMISTSTEINKGDMIEGYVK